MIRTFAAILFFSVSFAAAAGTPGGSAMFPQLDPIMPQRERDFLSIIGSARDQLNQSRTPNSAANVRMAMQIKIMDFVDVAYEAKDWAGIVKEHGRTREGDAWITIEMGPDVAAATMRALSDDPEHFTLIRAHSEVSDQLKHVMIGQKVLFSGTLLRYFISTDEAMIQRPVTYWHFDQIKLLSQ